VPSNKKNSEFILIYFCYFNIYRTGTRQHLHTNCIYSRHTGGLN